MSSDRRPTLADLPHRVRESLADCPDKFRQWRSELREDPMLLWRTPLLRIALWVALGIALVFAARWLTVAMAPRGGPGVVRPPAPYAILYTACTDSACRANFTTRQPLDFDDWPLKCATCGKDSVYRASLCPVCRKWFAIAPGGDPGCPFCAAARVVREPAEPVHTRPTNSDDDEDPWK